MKAKMPKGNSRKARYERCVMHVKGAVKNPWAVCNASVKKKAPKKHKGKSRRR